MEVAGEGALLALLARLKARLEAEGLFAAERKRALPYIPGVIGVITSPTGAVIRDILHRLAGRFPSRVLVWPVAVQGQGAAEQVAAAPRGFPALAEGHVVPRPDLVIVARGGGAIEDLWAFNEEVVVRAIAASAIPVISAVGHETDTTLADFAADLRAPTPTAAAELAVPVLAELAATITELALRKRRGQLRALGLARERLATRAQRLPPPQQILGSRAQRLDDLAERLRRGLVHRTEIARVQLARGGAALRPALLEGRAERASERLRGFGRVLRQLHYDAPLKRGYARVSAPGKALVGSRAAAAGEPRLTLHFHDGAVEVAPAGRASPRKPAEPRGDQPKLL
jgi:exodeoxyribonuclease VII large subunit